MYTHHLAKLDSSTRVSGRLAGHIMGWCPLPSLTPEELFCTCVVWEVYLTPRLRKMWPPYLLRKQGPAPRCSCHCLYLKCQQETNSSCSAWGHYLLPHCGKKVISGSLPPGTPYPTCLHYDHQLTVETGIRAESLEIAGRTRTSPWASPGRTPVFNPGGPQWSAGVIL